MHLVKYPDGILKVVVCDEGHTPFSQRWGLIYTSSTVYISFDEGRTFYRTPFKTKQKLRDTIKSCTLLADVIHYFKYDITEAVFAD